MMAYFPELWSNRSNHSLRSTIPVFIQVEELVEGTPYDTMALCGSHCADIP